MTIHWKAIEQYFTVCFFDFTQFVILENLSILDLALSGVKGLICRGQSCYYRNIYSVSVRKNRYVASFVILFHEKKVLHS